MASSNLDFSIGADTSKARVDLKLLQQELKNVNREIDNAIKAGDIAQANQLSAAYGNIEKQSIALKNSLRAQRTETDRANDSFKEFIHSSRGLGRVFNEFSTLTRGVESLSGMLGTLTGGFTGGLFGVAVTRGFAELLTALDEVDKKLLEIRDTARQTNLAPLAVQAGQEISKSLGESADDATKMMTGMSSLMEKARTAPGVGPGLGPTVFRGEQATGGVQGVQVYRGAVAETGKVVNDAGEKVAKLGSQIRDGIAIFRGGAPILTDFSKPLEIIGVNLNRFTGDAKGTLEAQRAIEQGFLRMQKTLDPTQLNALSKALFQGLPAGAALELAPKLIAELTAKIAELEKSSIGATKEREDAIRQLRISQNATDTQFQKMMGTIDDMIRPARITWNEFLKSIFTDVPKTAEEVAAAQGLEPWKPIVEPMKQAFADGLQWVQDAFNDFWKALGEQKGLPDVVAGWIAALPDFQPWIDKTLAAFRGMWDSIKAGAAALTAGDPSKSIPPIGFASGGMIRGPGTGTSDSILARLSNGEFVMRASAVRAWGADFMRSINSFSDGGLVRPIPRFAGGGMVTATTSDGVTVNLHFPGGTFALRGDAAIVGGLTREARRAGMLSAGRLAGALA